MKKRIYEILEKAQKSIKKGIQAITTFSKKNPWKTVSLSSLIVGVFALAFGIHYGKRTATKKEVKNIVQRIVHDEGEKTRTVLHSFIDGFAENISSGEPLKGKMEEADALFHEKKYEESYAQYDKINKKALSAGKEKLFVLSLIGKGISVAKQKDYQRAIGILKNAEDCEDFLDDKAKAKLYYNLGMCNEILKNSDLAIEYSNKTLNLAPRRFIHSVYLLRGFAYADKREYERAIRDFDKVIELNPKDFDAYLHRGITYTAKREYKRAIQDLDKAIELKPKDALGYYFRGELYDDKGEYERAIQDYDRAIELNPRDFVVYFSKAVTCDKIKKHR